MASWYFIAARKYSEVIYTSFTGVGGQFQLLGSKLEAFYWIYLVIVSLFHLVLLFYLPLHTQCPAFCHRA